MAHTTTTSSRNIPRPARQNPQLKSSTSSMPPTPPQPNPYPEWDGTPRDELPTQFPFGITLLAPTERPARLPRRRDPVGHVELWRRQLHPRRRDRDRRKRRHFRGAVGAGVRGSAKRHARPRRAG